MKTRPPLRVKRSSASDKRFAATPAALGYRMPAEWEPHAATWLAWPYNPVTWGGHLKGAEETFLRIIDALLPHEDVHLLVPGKAEEQCARRKLGPLASHPSLSWHSIETGDVWIRDYGPIFVIREHSRPATSLVPCRSPTTGPASDVVWVKFTYNALGKVEEYADLLVGNEVSDKMPIQQFPHFDANMVLEGGSIDVNGDGQLLTTESCLLHPSRNPQLARENLEEKLRDYLGVRQVCWLLGGIAGDDTDGHVDDVARFVAPDTVVACVERDSADVNYTVLRENLRRLRAFRLDGRLLNIVELPMPHPFLVEGRRMAASYANFYVANGAVLVPTYAQPSDDEGLNILQSCFPNLQVIGIDCRELIYGYGAVHCCTMQQPRDGT